MTERLYYDDSLLIRFDATVREAGVIGDRPFAVLDRTAFYPTSGGQPFDVGVLGGRGVVEVIDRDDDGAVQHVLDGPLEPGTSVSGEIDWPRRLDHMQQHTGQHVLSAAFVRSAGARTVSFHLGAELSTIDLAATVDAEGIRAAEDEANRVVWENRDVRVRYVSDEEAAALPLRKEPARKGMLRVVEIDAVDLSACGGTHVPRTGVIGTIAVHSWERYKGGTRVSFACGGRVLAHFRAYRDVIGAAVRQLSIQPSELPLAVARLQSETKELRVHVRVLSEQLAAYQADALVRGVRDLDGTFLVCEVVEGRDAAGLKSLAQAVVSRPKHAAVLIGAAQPLIVVATRAADATLDAAGLVRALVARFGGKGGGRPDSAQAGGLSGDPAVVRQAALDFCHGGTERTEQGSPQRH